MEIMQRFYFAQACCFFIGLSLIAERTGATAGIRIIVAGFGYGHLPKSPVTPGS
jgi:hypothetical protein